MTENETEKKVADLYQEAGVPLNKLDVGITLMKMTSGQLADLNAMIDYYQGKETASFVAAQVGYDLGGLKNQFINGPCGFSPRSKGFAKYLRRYGDE